MRYEIIVTVQMRKFLDGIHGINISTEGQHNEKVFIEFSQRKFIKLSSSTHIVIMSTDSNTVYIIFNKKIRRYLFSN